MPDVEVLPILVATVAAFILSGTYYALLGNQLAANEPTPPWTIAAELLRSLILAAVVAGLAVQGGIHDVAGGLALGVALWVGFPLLLWTGAIIHEKTPLRLAVIHGGDWLAKLLVVGVIVSVW
jgi:hypothetical protein